MFIATLFTIARRWKQPKCPLTDEWINKTWHTCKNKNVFQPGKGSKYNTITCYTVDET